MFAYLIYIEEKKFFQGILIALGLEDIFSYMLKN